VTAELIPDPDEERPPDAPDNWSPTLISNPDWEKLQSQVLRNPEYHGRWSPPKIKNPNYLNEPLTGVFEEPIGAVAVIVKTKTPGILIDNIDFEIIDSE